MIKVMKAKISLAVLVLFLGCSVQAFAQMTAYANIYATVVAEQPIMVRKTANLTFNDISAQRSGTIILSGNDLTASGAELAQNGQGTVASFSVVGGNQSTFDVSLPKESYSIGDGRANNLIVDNFAFTQSTKISKQYTESEIRISATLHVPDYQTARMNDTQNNFPVTLNYN
jgi:hypothetical protein